MRKINRKKKKKKHRERELKELEASDIPNPIQSRPR